MEHYKNKNEKRAQASTLGTELGGFVDSQLHDRSVFPLSRLALIFFERTGGTIRTLRS